MQIQAIFSDVDGTLINSHFEVTPKTRRILENAVRRGIRFYIVSARSPSGIRTIIRENDLHCGMVAHSGALVLDEKGRILYDRAMSGRKAAEVLDFLQRLKGEFPGTGPGNPPVPFTISLFSYDDWFAEDRSDPRMVEEESIVKTRARNGGLSVLRGETPVHKIMCLCEPEILDRLEERVKGRFPALAVVRAWENLLEIKEEGVNKAAALLALMKSLGLDPAGSVAFGDHHNDIEMLQAAGCGVAMGNAREEVKRVADMVTADNDHDGIAEALEKILGKRQQASNLAAGFEL